MNLCKQADEQLLMNCHLGHSNTMPTTRFVIIYHLSCNTPYLTVSPVPVPVVQTSTT